jgi:hypothetical protein
MAGPDNHVLDGDGRSKQKRLTAVPTPRTGPTSTNRPPRLLAEGLLMHAFRPAKGFTAIEYGRRVLKGAKLGEHDRQYADTFAPMNLEVLWLTTYVSRVEYKFNNTLPERDTLPTYRW